MLKQISHVHQTIYSELAQRALDASFVSEFDTTGRFVPVQVKGKRYWYFDVPDGEGGQTRRYVGPGDDQEIEDRVRFFDQLKADMRERRKLVSTLVREAYLPQPERLTGNIIEALENAGFFRLRGVLVGTLAFQAYSALLGVRLPKTAMVTSDSDFAKFHSISVAVQDSMTRVLDCLKSIDESFREIPHQSDGRMSTKYVNAHGHQVEFLTPNRGSDENQGHPTRMPSLGGSSAEPLRFLDYLIYNPVRAVLLHRAGVPITVPAPERYAIHKLIVASRRRAQGDSTMKSHKDLHQSEVIMQALLQQHREDDLAEAYMEAHNRGPAWQAAITKSLNQIEDGKRQSIEDGIARGIERLGEDVKPYDLNGHAPPSP
ncbi:nucleotidyltransferase family protein [Fodinicurvata fenggangensis]|uniref:nucleotidyltransferase family protein n=1 Tax=Fodinicurvata fenggangensis TaxID=1121830 RepID=UPI00047935E3|nr:GSU2403 family nucleotidyltransferase fold protein [Fodinicurvata fenggangensis]